MNLTERQKGNQISALQMEVEYMSQKKQALEGRVMKAKRQYLTKTLALLGLTLLLLVAVPQALPAVESSELSSFIVQGESLVQLNAAVNTVGGQVTHELAIINAVGATLTPTQLRALERQEGVTGLFANVAVNTAGGGKGGGNGGGGNGGGGGRTVAYTDFPAWVGADQLHAEGILGTSVTVAVLDTGRTLEGPIVQAATGGDRTIVSHNTIAGLSGYDDSGHATHVMSMIANSETATSGKYNGVAPDVRLAEVKAFDANGGGTYLDVIEGIDWIVANKDTYNIRVLNLSFSATPQSYYWEDPLNQAVMRAWQEGIVVVAAAGNGGPNPMTVGVPGNVPYIITVGAASDNYTPGDDNDDFLASFSAAGPTVEGFVKPDVVAPGGHLVGIMSQFDVIAETYPEYHDGRGYYMMSGTSQATGVVSGIVALMLDVDPTLTPDVVKCRLMATARPALDENDELAYSIFQQGAGFVDAYSAVHSAESGCANQGLNIQYDLDGTQHYQGKADQNASGDYYIVDQSGLAWSGGTFWAGGFAWSGGTFWAGGFAWSGGTFWAGGFAWSSNYSWDENPVWGASAAGINQWVDQE